MVGDVHLAKIYFTNNQGYKIRPILIIKINTFGDFIYVPITTSNEISGVPLKEGDFKEGGIPKQSVIVFEKISVISTELISKKLGVVNDGVLFEVISKIVVFLSDKNIGLS